MNVCYICFEHRWYHPAQHLTNGPKHAIVQLDNRLEINMQWFVSTFPPDSPICGGTHNTQHALDWAGEVSTHTESQSGGYYVV